MGGIEPGIRGESQEALNLKHKELAMEDAMEARMRVVEQTMSTHEAVCAERYAGIISTHADIRSDLKATKSLLTKIGLALMGGMALILANLLFHA